MSQESTLSDYLRVIYKRRVMILCLIGAALAITLVSSFFMTRIYRAEVVLMPLGDGSGEGGVASLMAQMGVLSPLVGAATISTELTVLLKSWSLAERMVNRFDLKKVYFSEFWDEEKKEWKGGEPSLTAAARRFQKSILVEDNARMRTLVVAVESPDRKVAFDLAEGAIDELQKFIDEKQLSDASRQRVFIESQLVARKEEWLESGKELAHYFEQNRISATRSQIDVPIKWSDSAPSEVQTPLADLSLDRLSGQISDLEQKINHADAQMKKSRVVRGVPQQLYLEYLNQRRQILAGLISLLEQQYQAARINEVRKEFSFEVIDHALMPSGPVRPAVKSMLFYSFVFTLFASVFLAFFLEYFVAFWRSLRESRNG